VRAYDTTAASTPHLHVSLSSLVLIGCSDSALPWGLIAFGGWFSQQLAEVLRGVGHGEAALEIIALPLVQGFVLHSTSKVGLPHLHSETSASVVRPSHQL
jgi:hypothetical protein